MEINFGCQGWPSPSQGRWRARQKNTRRGGCAPLLRIQLLRSGNDAPQSFPKMASKGRMEDVSHSWNYFVFIRVICDISCLFRFSLIRQFTCIDEVVEFQFLSLGFACKVSIESFGLVGFMQEFIHTCTCMLFFEKKKKRFSVWGKHTVAAGCFRYTNALFYFPCREMCVCPRMFVFV